MSTESCSIDRQPLQECLEQGRSAREEYADAWTKSLDEFADLRANLESWQQKLTLEQVDFERVRSIFEEEKCAYSEETASKKDEHAALRDQLDAADVGREHLREELESAHSSIETLEETRSENEQLKTRVRLGQTELESTQRVIEDLRSELEVARDSAAETGDEHEQLKDVIEGLADAQNEAKLKQQLADETREQCEALETELETVRIRAVELSDTLARERHQMASDRAEWADEFKRLRQQAEHQVATGRSATEPPAEIADGYSSPDASSPATASSNIVIGSVLAQFDRIRRQRARQRIHD